jgi:threonine aldolase
MLRQNGAVRDIEFRSDNSAGVAPEIMAAVVAANTGSALAYGGDAASAELERLVKEVFESPSARVFPVGSGTGANALAVSSICPPWGLILTHATAHMLNMEAGASSMFAGGAVIRGVPGDDYRIHADGLEAALGATVVGDPHFSQPSVLSLTQPTDRGTMYSVDDVQALSKIAHDHGLRVHMDGARISNALVSLGCSPAELTWRAGVDVLTLGATKNGALSTEAIVTFDDRAADELVYRTKRAGHVTSKMRFQSAQLVAYLTDDLWLHLAANANAQMTRLVAGLEKLGLDLLNRPDVNIVFLQVDADLKAGLGDAGLLFHELEPGVIRFVTNFQTTTDDIDAALERIAALTG